MAVVKRGYRVGLWVGACVLGLCGAGAGVVRIAGAPWRGAHVCTATDDNKTYLICNRDDGAVDDASAASLVYGTGNSGFTTDDVVITIDTVAADGSLHQWGTTVRAGLLGGAQAADSVQRIFGDANVVLLAGQTYRLTVASTNDRYEVTRVLGAAVFTYQ